MGMPIDHPHETGSLWVQLQAIKVVNDMEQVSLEIDHFAGRKLPRPLPQIHIPPHGNDRCHLSQHMEHIRLAYISCMDDESASLKGIQRLLPYKTMGIRN